jgi:hypothetical protein
MRINLVQGHSAGGLLRQACRQFGLPGEVQVIDDDLSVGPLRDDPTRNQWWRNVWGPSPEAFQPNLYDQWQAFKETLDRLEPADLVLWSSDSARDYVFERMAAFILRDYAGDLFKLQVPSSRDLEGVGYFPPDALASMEYRRLALTPKERANLASTFDYDLQNSEGIRELKDGVIAMSSDDALDQFLLEHCPSEWTKWYRVIGQTMADCNGQNLISDAFFSWRLRSLVEAAQVEAQGDILSSDRPKKILVRRAGASQMPGPSAEHDDGEIC